METSSWWWWPWTVKVLCWEIGCRKDGVAEGKQTFHIYSIFDLAVYQITVVTVIAAIICDDLF